MSARRAALLAAGLVALPAAAVLGGCAGATEEGSGVVVTTNILGDVTRAVVGDEAEVTVLMEANADPHSFGLSARQAAELRDAELLVHNGLGLEEGVGRNVAAAEEAGTPTLAVGEHVDPLHYGADVGHGGEVDGSDSDADSGDAAGAPDPHFWTDPRRVATAVELIADQVIEEVDGVDADAVRAHADDYLDQLEELDGWMAERFAEIPDDGRSLVTNHHVFGYLAERYAFEVIGAVIPSGTTLASPSAADLEELAGAVREAGVEAIFADSSQPDRLAQALADEVGRPIDVIELYSESLTAEGEGAATYLEMMRANTDAIVAGLAGD